MSIRDFIDNQSNFNLNSIISNKLNVGGTVHQTQNNKYTISNANNTLISFDENTQLSSSSMKTYCDAINNNVNTFNTAQLALIGNIQSQVSALNIQIQNVPTDANYTALQAQVTTLTTYMQHLIYFMKILSKSLNIIDPNTGNQFDFTNLL